MDPIWVTIAFVLGFAMRQIGLPPLVGYLLAGFVLNAMGVEGGTVLEEISELGVTLLLFSIGLKLRLRSLIRPEVWAGASLHMIVTVIVFGAGIFGLSAAGFAMFHGLDLKLSVLIAFALSFSSTVFAVKVLEERGEMASLHGRVSIGILIVQDILAVIFLTAASGKIPSPWALALPVYLLALRPILMILMSRCGHGELLVLLGLFQALVLGAAGFELVGMKADLGALILGVLVAAHPKASELAKSLLGFKDLFLVGFFLSIGLSGVPSLGAVGVALLLTAAVPFKVALFFGLLTRFKLRARTSLLASLSLANYSEFGLIVGAIGVSNGWIGSEWLVIIAIALSITFVLASPLNSAAHTLYARMADKLKPFETKTRHPDDEPIDPGATEIAIFGMGRIGTQAYDAMHDQYGDIVVGIDYDSESVRKHQEAGRRVIMGDATDSDFWTRIQAGGRGQIRLVMLAMPKHSANLDAAKQLAEADFPGLIAAIAQFDDQVEDLKEHGVQAAFNFYSEAATGFVQHVTAQIESAKE